MQSQSFQNPKLRSMYNDICIPLENAWEGNLPMGSSVLQQFAQYMEKPTSLFILANRLRLHE
jgi:hypothetical protein